jgi:adenosylcobyric acid synthase
VLGVVPHLPDLGLPEEDSVAFKQGRLFRPRTAEQGLAELDVACLDLPHISNFTDLDPLAAEPGVIPAPGPQRPANWDVPDLLILPGTKNVMADMAFLRKRGLAAAVRLDLAERPERGSWAFAAGSRCSARPIDDPHALESTDPAARSPGLGLLPLHHPPGTGQDPVPDQRSNIFAIRLCLSGLRDPSRPAPILQSEPRTRALLRGFGRPHARGLGLECDKPVWGSYLHGIFDDTAFRHWLLNTILAARERRRCAFGRDLGSGGGPGPAGGNVRRHLDIRVIYQTLGVR